jgi:hypothetical protein
MALKKGSLTVYPNIRPGIGWNIIPGLRAYVSMGVKGPRFNISGDPKKFLKALGIGDKENGKKDGK